MSLLFEFVLWGATAVLLSLAALLALACGLAFREKQLPREKPQWF